MIFTLDALRGIAEGRITLAFRRWETPRVKAGARQRSAMGVIEIVSVEPVAAISDDDAVAAGFADASEALAVVDNKSRGGSLYRIGLRYVGADPRHALREHSNLTADELDALHTRLHRMDRGDTWTESYLRLIAANPGVVARELAAQVGMERDPFKIRVRRLKDLGLTESLDVGYRISPRGEAVLASIAAQLPRDAVLVGEGRMAQVFALDSQTVVKLDRPEFNGVADYEAAILRELGELSLPVPRVLDAVVFDGRHGIVMERLHGPSLTAVIEGGRDVRHLADEFVDVQLALHRAAPQSAPPLVLRLAAEIERSGLPAATIDELLDCLADPDGDAGGDIGLCHFDLHPDNVVVTDSGWSVIDWIGAAVGPTIADFVRTLLLRADETDGPMAEFMRHVRTIGMGRRSIDTIVMDRWLRILAAARLAEGFTGDYAERLRAMATGDTAPLR